ncbi:L-type lectin-domain containing receptor kinase IX.1-like [Ipomoea triloba]|uniref:L-type lectin-domain containing receptor kinase IX.1-like n=1 Tax=Ipomoea triloba TaxID=35885 RepID=UPI00125D7A83|nr:L-type lectin-domain containing receptor kinase IX.1-like [Ipomoea triloba]
MAAAAAAAVLCRFLNVRAFVFLLLISFVHSLSFDLQPIVPADTNLRIKVEGDASITTQGLQLTPYDRKDVLNYNAAGRARYNNGSLHLWDKATRELADFTTHFTFNIDSDGNASFADGLAFFLADFKATFNKTATLGGGLGLMDTTLVKSPEPFIAVVFDTFSNEDNAPETSVSINLGSWNQSANSTRWLNDVERGKDNNASITYTASSKMLQVVFTGFSDGYRYTDSLSYEVDLRDYLPEFVSIGFSAATGYFFEKNTVSSWRFNSTPLTSDTTVSPPPAPSPSKGTHSSHPPPTIQNQGKNNQRKGIEIAGLSIATLVLLLLLPLAIYICFKKRWAAKGDNQITLGRPMNDDNTQIIIDGAMDNTQVALGRAMDGEFQKVGSGAKKFSYSELATATNNFSEEQKLGEGGFGGVYSGFLSDLKLNVAVKRVSKQSKQGVEEYATEVKIISRLRHRNLVPLHGWCHDKGELLLVYEYMPGGSLDSHLFKRNSPLSWRLRYKIAQGLASALSYLHEEWEKCVLHRDIKSSNVLLDSSLNARLGDFGLAWLVDHENAAEKTYLGGTVGYVAPECHFTFKTSKESDVYSFGIVILEIACGRRSIFPNEPEGVKSLVDWVWDLYGMGKLLEAADSKLCENFDEQEMERLIVIGLWCAHPDNNSRPSITQVVHCLKFQFQLPILPPKMPKPVYSTCTSAVSLFSASCSSGTEPFDRQEFEYHTNSSRDNTRLTSSSVSGGSSTSASLPQIF